MKKSSTRQDFWDRFFFKLVDLAINCYNVTYYEIWAQVRSPSGDKFGKDFIDLLVKLKGLRSVIMLGIVSPEISIILPFQKSFCVATCNLCSNTIHTKSEPIRSHEWIYCVNLPFPNGHIARHFDRHLY